MATELDHVIWGVPDLEDGVREMEDLTGVRAAYGGRHPGVGTHNAILDLGERRYLEILAPDPSQTRFSSFGALVRDLEAPQMLGWAARTDDVRALAETVRRGGMRPGVVLSLSRRAPSGRMLSWRLMQVEGQSFGAVFPFFIEWRTDDHPSQDAPEGCRLRSLDVRTPRFDELRSALGVVGLTQEIRTGEAARLSLVMTTPKGKVELV